jgi:hypothetical protein
VILEGRNYHHLTHLDKAVLTSCVNTKIIYGIKWDLGLGWDYDKWDRMEWNGMGVPSYLNGWQVVVYSFGNIQIARDWTRTRLTRVNSSQLLTRVKIFLTRVPTSARDI